MPADAAASCPSGQPTITVRSHGGGGSVTQTDEVCLADLDNWIDVTGKQYRTYTGSGGPSDEPLVGQGTSVSLILQKLNIAGVTMVTAQSGANAHRTLLDQSDLGSTADGLTPVFFSDSSQFIRFARPMRDEGDANYQDVWSSDAGGDVLLDAYTQGRVLHPNVTATATSTEPGGQVGFRVTFDGLQPTGTSYAWDFGDGTSSTVAAPSHSWSRGGSSYSVNLTVHGDGDANGDAQTVVIRVGSAPSPSPNATAPGTGSGGHHHPVTGPSAGSGHAAGGTATPAPGTGNTGTAPPVPTPTGTSSSGASSGAQPSRSPRPHVAAAGLRVSGVLLTHTEPVTLSNPQSVRQAASARAAPGLHWDRSLLWLLLLPGTLLLGAASQTRWLARRLPQPVWRR